ncbi:MAG: hypothetical protein VB112_10020, partial [Oscillospiraceae bacterium]|nr:hypothetical protein [Oscillospiraceae bacterium]
MGAKQGGVRRAKFSIIMALVFLIPFTGVYWFLSQRTIEPHYYLGLIFAIPFASFAVVTCLLISGIIKKDCTILITAMTVFFSIYFIFLAPITVLGAVIHDETADVTDIDNYDRVIKLNEIPEKLTDIFPDTIPDGAKAIHFYYHPFAIGQGGQEIALEFEADSDTKNDYIDKISKRAEWIGKAGTGEAEQHGVFDGTFCMFDYANSGLPNDYDIYAVYSKADV